MRHKKIPALSTAALLASTSVILFMPGLAAAQASYVCSTKSLDRSIEVVQPDYGSAVCKVLYRKPDEGAPDQFLWRSNQSMAFCEEKAQELVASLTATGFDCTEGKIDAVIASAQPIQTKGQAPAPTVTNAALKSQPLAQAPQSSDKQNVPMGGVPYQRVANQTDTSWHLAGYADATFVVSNMDGTTTTDFSAARFNPGFHFQYKDLILLEAEAEISVNADGETDVELEYAQADIFLHDNATLVVGQFLSPVGQFQERLHPTWINRLADAPAGFGHDGVQPASDVGAMLRGGILIGEEAIATYAIAVGNGPRISHEGGVAFEAKGGDDNSNKAVSGRVGFLPFPYLEVGGSFLFGDVTGVEEEAGHDADPVPMPAPVVLEPTDAKVMLWGADAAYTRGPWNVRFEYLNMTRDPIATAFEGSVGVEMLPELELQAWYAQIAYRLSEITDHQILQRFEPVVRYGEFKVSGLDELAEEAAEERLDVGLNYWIAPSIVARGVGQWRDFTDREVGEPSSETRFLLQLAYGF